MCVTTTAEMYYIAPGDVFLSPFHNYSLKHRVNINVKTSTNSVGAHVLVLFHS